MPARNDIKDEMYYQVYLQAKDHKDEQGQPGGYGKAAELLEKSLGVKISRFTIASAVRRREKRLKLRK